MDMHDHGGRPLLPPEQVSSSMVGHRLARQGCHTTHKSRTMLRSPAGAGCRPFLLQSRASYTAIGIFSVASYPYSFKLLWSPVVDSVYSLAFGRRKSWVVRRAPRAGRHASPRLY